jgi:aminoglycoside phosphotransferase (APT) family kinase protein
LTPQQIPAYLAARGLTSDPRRVTVRELSGGVSNYAWWVERPEGPLVLKQARAQLAVAMEWLADVRRIVREAEAMDWLHGRIGRPAIPEMLLLDREAMVLAMEAVLPPAENYKTLLMRGDVTLEHADRIGALLARLHNVGADPAAREAFGDATFFDQLRMSPYYDTVARRHPALAGVMAALRAECMEQRWCLVHGDYSAKNVLVRGDGRLVLLDYEVAHFGNPCFDLGFVLPDYLCLALLHPARGSAYLAAARRLWLAYQHDIRLTARSRERAGYHLAAILLARVDGKSPFEYFTDPVLQQRVRVIAGDALLARDTTISSVIANVEQQPA